MGRNTPACPKGRVKWFSRDKATGVWSTVIIVLNCATRGGFARHDELIRAFAIVTFHPWRMSEKKFCRRRRRKKEKYFSPHLNERATHWEWRSLRDVSRTRFHCSEGEEEIRWKNGCCKKERVCNDTKMNVPESAREISRRGWKHEESGTNN